MKFKDELGTEYCVIGVGSAEHRRYTVWAKTADTFYEVTEIPKSSSFAGAEKKLRQYAEAYGMEMAS